jgi:Flp pilus assembly protein TadD
MKSQKRFSFIAALGAILIVLLPGCGGTWRSKKASPTVVQVEREGVQKPTTPSEQAASFDQAYAEGLKLVKNGEYGLALGAFEMACDARPNSPEAIFNLGACHEAIGDPLRAINYYKHVLEISPDDPDCYRNLGTSFIKL